MDLFTALTVITGIYALALLANVLTAKIDEHDDIINSDDK